jgi:protein TonB
MRVYTFFVSTVVHITAVIALLVSSLVATDVLPDPRHATEYVVVTPELPPPPPSSRPRKQIEPRPAPAVDAVPLEAPDGLHPESDVIRAPLLNDSASVVSGGIPFADVLQADPLPPPPPVVAPVRVGGTVRPPQKIKNVAPDYPAIARAARKEGVVILEAVIGADGTVSDVRVLRSIPLLDDAAVNAVRQWQFTPTLLNGIAVPVVMTVTVAFTLR